MAQHLAVISLSGKKMQYARAKKEFEVRGKA
jgi:hypothetical protein